MDSKILEAKKLKHFDEFMFCSTDWLSYLSYQLSKFFTDEEAISYINFIISQLTPNYKSYFLKRYYEDISLFDEITDEDRKDNNNLADIVAHLRCYAIVEKEFDNLKPLLLKKKEEIESVFRYREINNKQKARKKIYPYQTFKLNVRSSKENEVLTELFRNLKDDKLIPSNENFINFANIFRGREKKIVLDKRVVWNSSVSSLKMFVESLLNENLIEFVEEKWIITSNCFRNKKLEPYNNSKLNTNHEKVTTVDSNSITNVIKALKIDLEI
jgi:hypothetical protein